MASVSCRITMNRFPVVKRAFPGAVDRRVRRSAEAVRDGAKRRSRVDTGEMQAGWKADGGNGVYTVSNDVDHTIYNEYGTRYMTAQPMLHPAMDEENAKIVNRFLDIEADLI